MSSKTSDNGSTLATSSTLRPRTKRLISGLSEGDESAPDAFDSPPRRIASPAPSPFDSRSASPIPAAHPQRSSLSRTRDEGPDRYAGYSSWGRRAQVSGAWRGRGEESPNSLASIWGSSWTTLQGLATDFLGNDLPPSGDGSMRAKQKQMLGSRLRTSSASGGDSWGPTSTPGSHTTIGSGTKESRENALRAAKRKDMLTRGDSSYTADALGKIKRRLSDEQESRSAPPGENDDRAALVYVHHVGKDDTLAGITIKYNCAASVVRKANRMWPNDTVQSRQTIVLPVDACGVKGKPVAGPEAASAIDLLAGDDEVTDSMAAEEVTTSKPTLPNGDGSHENAAMRDRTSSLSTTSPRTSTSLADNNLTPTPANTSAGEPPWHHDSWVLLPSFTQPTEIARLSRRALGYFPPARRKSLSSDINTPSTSLDLPRPSLSAITSPPDITINPAEPQRPRRQRRLSNATTGYFPSYLAGPGGVGTMSKNVHFPGPAQDGLNKMFAKHLPDVAPPRNQVELYQPELPLYTDDETPQASGNVTPSLLPRDHGNVVAMNLENVGGVIESWVRRMATKAMTTPTYDSGASGSGSQKNSRKLGPRASLGAPGKGTGGVGDLIEMTDEFEIGGDDDDEGETLDRGRSGGYLSQTADVGGAERGSSSRNYFGGAVATARGLSKGGPKSGKND